jgi:hypothetical protein
MRLTNRSLVLASLLVILLLATTVVPALAKPAASDICNYGSTPVFVSCANGGLGEAVIFTGPVPCSIGSKLDPKSGALYIRTFFNRRSVSGIGPVTGNEYVGNGPYESKVYGNVGPWGPIGTQASMNDVWYIESDEVLYTRTYTLRTNLVGVVTETYSEDCQVKDGE